VNISNGGTVTAITGVTAGTYTTIPTVTVTSPTTAGGVQATVTASMQVQSNPTINVAGSGYAVSDTLTLVGGTFTTAAVYTIATISGSGVATTTLTTAGSYTVLPTAPIATTSSGAGTGCTLTPAWGVRTGGFTITNAGSGYVEQPTITFSSGSATAYATVGSAGAIKFLGASSSIQNATGNALVFQEGGVATPVAVVIKNAASAQMYSSVTNSNFLVSSNGTGYVSFQTSTLSLEQMRVSHTASAVNYVQVTGSATGSTSSGYANILFTGSDTSVGGAIVSKGNTSQLNFSSGSTGSVNFIVKGATNGLNTGNAIQVSGAIAGASPTIYAVSGPSGTDANIDINLTPKGTGVLSFGTYTVSALLAVAGYITIKDSGGTTRRLLVG
jgi:hypothetical protein